MNVNLIPAGRWMDDLIDELVYGAYGESRNDMYFYCSHSLTNYSIDTMQAFKLVNFILIHNIENHWVILLKCAYCEYKGWEWSTYIGAEGGSSDSGIKHEDVLGSICQYCGGTMRNSICQGCGSHAVLIGDPQDWGVAPTLALSICRASLIAMGIRSVKVDQYDTQWIGI